MTPRVVAVFYPEDGMIDRVKSYVDEYARQQMNADFCKEVSTRIEDDDVKPLSDLPSRRNVRRSVSGVGRGKEAHQIHNGAESDAEGTGGGGMNSNTAAALVMVTFLLCVTGIIIAAIVF